ncbi:MAG: Mov34/MPN/PAD-1 family protein [Candidatus Micrarchaeia archaeon]
MLIISNSAWLSMLAGSQGAFPNEFLALLEGEKTEEGILIKRLVIPPGIFVNSNSAQWSPWQLSPSINGIGTFHSHPGGVARPSRQDAFTNSKDGGVHLILGWPYSMQNLHAFGPQGEEIDFIIEK